MPLKLHGKVVHAPEEDSLMDRRAFIAGAAWLHGAAASAADSSAGRPPRIGFLGNANSVTGSSQREAFLRGLRERGWIEGQTMTVEYRWADGRLDRIAALVDELIEARVDVMALSGPVAIAAAQKATRTLPVVFVVLVDPVDRGFVKSLAHPGGNMTGLASQYEELVTKQMQLLKEALPRLSRLALLHHSASDPALLAAAGVAARSLGLVTTTLKVTDAAELAAAFEAARGERAEALHVLPSPSLGAQRATLIALAARHRLPAVYELRLYVADGGLMSYGPSIDDLYGRAATFVDRILKGASPGDLAIERPARFELVINRKTARALGLPLPRALLQRADEVID
jgi:putative ABC transport system substrate-binding protein